MTSSGPAMDEGVPYRPEWSGDDAGVSRARMDDLLQDTSQYSINASPSLFDHPYDPSTDEQVLKAILSEAFDILGRETPRDQIRNHAQHSIEQGLFIPIYNHNGFHTGKMLGKGGLCVVKAATHRMTGKVYAQSRLGSWNCEKRYFEALANEVNVAKLLVNMPHIVSVKYVLQCPDGVEAIYHHPVADGTLEEWFERCGPEGDLDRNQRCAMLLHMRTFFGCLATTVSRMHDARVQHRDIKPENILFLRDKLFFTDFNASKDGSTDENTSSDGPLLWKTKVYSAREIIKNERHGRAADIFSLGCVLFETLCVMCQNPNEPSILYEIRSLGRQKSYSAITGEMKRLLKSLKLPSFFAREDHENFPQLKNTIESMLDGEQGLRPHAANLRFPLSWSCDCCPPHPNDAGVHNAQAASARGNTLLPPDNGLPLRASMPVSTSNNSISTSASIMTSGDSDDSDHIPGSPETGDTTIDPDVGSPASSKPIINVIPPVVDGGKGHDGMHTIQGVENEVVDVASELSAEDSWCYIDSDRSNRSLAQQRVQQLQKVDSVINPGPLRPPPTVDLSDEKLAEIAASIGSLI